MQRSHILGHTAITQVTAFVPGMLQQWPMLPYSMHYWYFNVINPHTDFVQSYILARGNEKVHLNGKQVDVGSDHQYTTVLADFQNHRTTVLTEDIDFTDSKLTTVSAQLDLSHNQVNLVLDNHHYLFPDLYLPSCYFVDQLELYAWYNLVAKNSRTHFMAQNVIARGPLVPWTWLHFHFDNGVFTTMFNPVGQIHKLELGPRKLHVDNLAHTDNQVEISASENGEYFKLTLDKHYNAKVVYDPSWSPAWEYNQIHVTLNKLETNILGWESATNGTGILEVATGFAL